MKSLQHVSLMITLALLGGCTTHSFIPTGEKLVTHTAKPTNCGAKVLLNYPKKAKYSEIGICSAQVPGGGMISDKTPEAVIELQKCACLQGGDAIILGKANDAGFIGGFGYSQQVAKARGIVIVFE